uniref:Speckle-type POZ protein-like protein n=2 Tax=Aegilops tauschii TaxID=37682 RepID=R7W1Q6_AEGTA
MSALVSSLRAAGRHHLSAGTFVVRPVTGFYLYRIEQFKQIQKMLGNGAKIESETFRVGGHDWRVRCYPNGEEGYEGFIGLYLEHASLERTGDATADFRMSILDHTGKPSWTEGNAQLLEEIDDESEGDAQTFSIGKRTRWGWSDFMKVEDLDDKEHLKDGCLIIVCDVTVLDMHTIKYRDGMASTTTMVPPSKLHREPTEVPSESKEGSDPYMEIEVGRGTIPANRSMLAARSPVFKEELMPTKIHVEGIDADVFKALLHFIYTNTLPQEMEQQETLAKMAKPLLVAADRYKLEKMKLVCEESKQQNKELWQNLEQKGQGHIWDSSSSCTGLGVDVLVGHVVKEVVDVGEEIVVGKLVVGVRDEEVSSRAERFPKTLSPFSRTGLKEVRFRRPTVHAASRDGEDRSSSAELRNLWREEEEVLVHLTERSDLPFIGAREGGERAATIGEMKRQQPKGCTVRIRTPLSQKSFQLPCDLSYTRSAWQKFRHRLGSFPRRGASRCVAAGGGGGARVDVPLVLMLIQVGKEPSL